MTTEAPQSQPAPNPPGRLRCPYPVGLFHFYFDANSTSLARLEHSTREKSIWELYNEVAEKDDISREREWTELTDTMLVFVSFHRNHFAFA